MNNKVCNIADLQGIVYKRWMELDKLDSKYLSEDGVAAKEAYRAVIWHLSFHDTIASLAADEVFTDLVNISGKHPEYYRILRMINRFIEKLVS